MRYVKSFFKWFFILLVLLNVAIWLSGKTYLYKGIANTYLKGRSGPSIDEYQIFMNWKIETGEPQPWPISKKYNKKKLEGDQLQKFEEYETIAYLVIKDDSLLFEKYWDSYGPDSWTNSFSMAKSFTSVLLGAAINEGKVEGVHEKVKDVIPGLEGRYIDELEYYHLLTMSSGVNFDEDYANPFAYPAAAYYGDDLYRLSVGYKVEQKPGLEFNYLSGNTALLSFAIENATGKDLGDYLSEKLWKPMGAEHEAYWSMDNNVHEKAYCCFNSNARDFARFGKLYLDSGRWNGKQLVPEEYVLASTRPAQLKDLDLGKANTRYGYSWWITEVEGKHVYYARGILGQYIFVIPEDNLVVVRLGHKRDKAKVNGHPADVPFWLETALRITNN